MRRHADFLGGVQVHGLIYGSRQLLNLGVTGKQGPNPLESPATNSETFRDLGAQIYKIIRTSLGVSRADGVFTIVDNKLTQFVMVLSRSGHQPDGTWPANDSQA